MSDVSIFLGLDVHKDSIDIALVEGDRKATVDGIAKARYVACCNN